VVLYGFIIVMAFKYGQHQFLLEKLAKQGQIDRTVPPEPGSEAPVSSADQQLRRQSHHASSPTSPDDGQRGLGEAKPSDTA